MPGGIHVACVAIGSAGAKNATYLQAQILATSDELMAEKLRQERKDNAKGIATKDEALQKQLN